MAVRTIQPVPLELETRSTLPTSEAAFHLHRTENTLRIWKMRGTGPHGLRPQVVNGRLHWPVAELINTVKGVKS